MIFILSFIKTISLKNEGFGTLKYRKNFLFVGNPGENSWIIIFLFIEDELLNIPLEFIWNIRRKSLRQKGMDLLTNARGEFVLWKMAEKIRTCGRRRSDGGHNVGCDVGSNVAVRDVGLRSGNITSSYSSDIWLKRNSSDVGLSSNNVITDNVGILGQE